MQLLSIFVGQPTTIEYNDRVVETGIFKQAITQKVRVGKLNIEGDRQADLKVHGGVNKAVYAYPSEHYGFWKAERPDLSFEAGVFGENLSVTGMWETAVCIGDTFRIGTTVLSVTSPRMPCFKLGVKMGDPRFVGDFLKANRSGFYFKVVEEGEIEPGDKIEQVEEDGYGLTIEEVVRLYTTDKSNQELLQKAVEVPSLPEDWKVFFQQKLR